MAGEAIDEPVPLSYDAFIKSAFMKYYPDLAAWLLGEQPVKVRAEDTALAAAATRFTDKLLLLEYPQGTDVLLHVEFQTGGDPRMPTRMAQYLTLILDSLRAERDRPAEPACVVIYLDKETYRDDPGVLELEGRLGLRILVRYKVIKLWEEDPAHVLALDGLGLLPFLPLLRGNPEQLLVESREKILKAPEAVAPAETKRELFTILATIAARVIKDRRLVAGFLSEAEGMEIEGKPNVFLEMLAERASERGFNKGREKGRAEGREEGREEGIRQAIRRVLERRFGAAATEVGKGLDHLTDLTRLESLVDEAAICPDLATFIQQLPGPELTSSP